MWEKWRDATRSNQTALLYLKIESNSRWKNMDDMKDKRSLNELNIFRQGFLAALFVA